MKAGCVDESAKRYTETIIVKNRPDLPDVATEQAMQITKQLHYLMKTHCRKVEQVSQKAFFAFLEGAYDLVSTPSIETSFHACVACGDVTEPESDSGRSSESGWLNWAPRRQPPTLEPRVYILIRKLRDKPC